MFPLIALAAISVASSIAGGISANKKQRKADQILSDRERNLKEWYNSDTYQAAAKIRQEAADCNAAIIKGL